MSIPSFKTRGNLCNPARHLTPPSNSRLVRLYLGSVPLHSSNLACHHIESVYLEVWEYLPGSARFLDPNGLEVLRHSRDVHPTWASVDNVTVTLRVCVTDVYIFAYISHVTTRAQSHMFMSHDQSRDLTSQSHHMTST